MKHLSLIQAIVLLDDRKLRKQKRKCDKNADIQLFEITDENIDLASKLVHDILERAFLNLQRVRQQEKTLSTEVSQEKQQS